MSDERKKQRWSDQEDRALKAALSKRDSDITKMSPEDWAELCSRIPYTPKQARERWQYFLRPDLVRSTWDLDEELEMFRLVEKHGTAWRRITTMLGTHRSTAFVRNRYYSAIRTVQRNKGLDKEDAKGLIHATGGVEGLSIPSAQRWQDRASPSQVQDVRETVEKFLKKRGAAGSKKGTGRGKRKSPSSRSSGGSNNAGAASGGGVGGGARSRSSGSGGSAHGSLGAESGDSNGAHLEQGQYQVTPLSMSVGAGSTLSRLSMPEVQAGWALAGVRGPPGGGGGVGAGFPGSAAGGVSAMSTLSPGLEGSSMGQEGEEESRGGLPQVAASSSDLLPQGAYSGGLMSARAASDLQIRLPGMAQFNQQGASYAGQPPGQSGQVHRNESNQSFGSIQMLAGAAGQESGGGLSAGLAAPWLSGPVASTGSLQVGGAGSGGSSAALGSLSPVAASAVSSATPLGAVRPSAVVTIPSASASDGNDPGEADDFGSGLTPLGGASGLASPSDAAGGEGAAGDGRVFGGGQAATVPPAGGGPGSQLTGSVTTGTTTTSSEEIRQQTEQGASADGALELPAAGGGDLPPADTQRSRPSRLPLTTSSQHAADGSGPIIPRALRTLSNDANGGNKSFSFTPAGSSVVHSAFGETPASESSGLGAGGRTFGGVSGFVVGGGSAASSAGNVTPASVRSGALVGSAFPAGVGGRRHISRMVSGVSMVSQVDGRVDDREAGGPVAAGQAATDGAGDGASNGANGAGGPQASVPATTRGSSAVGSKRSRGSEDDGGAECGAESTGGALPDSGADEAGGSKRRRTGGVV